MVNDGPLREVRLISCYSHPAVVYAVVVLIFDQGRARVVVADKGFAVGFQFLFKIDIVVVFGGFRFVTGVARASFGWVLPDLALVWAVPSL